MSVSLDEIRQREQGVLCKTYARYPVSVARGQGTRLWDLDGKEYVDLLAGLAVVNLGHCNEEIAEVISAQARKLIHVSNLFYQEEQLNYADKILATCHLAKVFFCNSGAEANEAAIKLARRYQKKARGKDAWEVLTLENCFHGRTLATLAATGKHTDGFEPLPEGFRRVPYGDLAAMQKAVTPKTAAVLVEVVQGEGGIILMDPDYARGLQQLCRENGLLFMIDEVQSGVARSGKFWAFQNYGLLPDVVTSSKALANGLPLGSMLATDEAAQGFDYGSHATTFGGGALITAAAAKVVEIIERDQLAARAARVGDNFRAKAQKLAGDKPDKIKEVRGLGLLLGIELNMEPERAKEVWLQLLDKGFILNLAQGKVLRLLPPLTIEEEDLDRFLLALRDVL